MIFVYPQPYLLKLNQYYATLELGGYYIHRYTKRVYKLIKTTNRGYNLLDVDTNICLFNSHLYLSYKFKSKNQIKHIKVTIRYSEYKYNIITQLTPLDKNNIK